MKKHCTVAYLFFLSLSTTFNLSSQTIERLQTANFYHFSGGTGSGSFGTSVTLPVTAIGWTITGVGTIGDIGTGSNPNCTFFSYNNNTNSNNTQTCTQNITAANLTGAGATISIAVCPTGTIASNSDNATTVTIGYGPSGSPVTYCTVTIPKNSSGTLNNATIATSNGAGAPNITSIPLQAYNVTKSFAGKTITFTLPGTIPNNGVLQIQYMAPEPAAVNWGNADISIQSVSFQATPVTISGNVYDDANGLTDSKVNSTGGLTLPSGMFANLIDNTNTVVGTNGAVNASGAYSVTFPVANVAANGTSFSMVLTNTATSATATVPAGWAFAGESLTNGGAGDGTVNGILSLTTLTNNTNSTTNAANQSGYFGIDAIPTAKTVSKGPLPTWQFPLTDVAGYRGILSSDANTAPLSGNDTEDGPLGTRSSFKIISIASGTQLYYGTTSVAGNLLSVGSTITNYNPSLLRMYGATNSTGPSFTYASVDKANVPSPAQAYNVFSSNPLPVTLDNLTIKAVNCEAIVNWTGTVENNFSYYEVQQSTDEQDFTTAEKVTGKGSGTSYTSRFALSANTEYVRLKMTDNNGTVTYSNILPVTSNCANNLAPGLYPNPTSGSFTINNLGSGKKDILINAVNGALVYKGNTSNIQVTINSANWAPGIYFVKISTGGNVKVIKVVKQ